jgi:hypothetical protein
MWSTGSGADVMKRIAAPMVGGLVSSTVLTLVVIPSVYTIWRDLELRNLWRRTVVLLLSSLAAAGLVVAAAVWPAWRESVPAPWVVSIAAAALLAALGILVRAGVVRAGWLDDPLRVRGEWTSDPA